MRTSPILTENLILRPFRMSDVLYCYDNWMTDPDVTEFLTWEPHRDEGETATYLTMCIRAYRYGSMDWCICDLDDEPIGSITVVQDFPEDRYCELGYCLSKDHWDKGYMTEALRAVLGHIFRATDYLWVQARHDAENVASGRCMAKAGMRKVREFDDMCSKRQCVRHYVMYRIDRV